MMKYKYECSFQPFALAAHCYPSNKDKEEKLQLAVGSFIQDRKNFIDVLEIDSKHLKAKEDHKQSKMLENNMCTDLLRSVQCVEHLYFPTKLSWSPLNCSRQMLASCGISVNLWQCDSKSGKIKHLQSLHTKEPELSAPLTSLDWNTCDPSILGTSSIDTTCTIWNVETGQTVTQLIAHDKQVNDIAFSNTAEVFGSAGGDGSLRIFDTRNLDHSTILYISPSNEPMLRLAWNKFDPNFIISFGLHDEKIILSDLRVPLIPLAELTGHEDKLNDVSWSPHSAAHLVSAGDDGQILIWNILENLSSDGLKIKPTLSYRLSTEVNQLVWPSNHPDWIAIADRASIQLINI